MKLIFKFIFIQQKYSLKTPGLKFSSPFVLSWMHHIIAGFPKQRFGTNKIKDSKLISESLIISILKSSGTAGKVWTVSAMNPFIM